MSVQLTHSQLGRTRNSAACPARAISVAYVMFIVHTLPFYMLLLWSFMNVIVRCLLCVLLSFPPAAAEACPPRSVGDCVRYQ